MGEEKIAVNLVNTGHYVTRHERYNKNGTLFEVWFACNRCQGTVGFENSFCSRCGGELHASEG